MSKPRKGREECGWSQAGEEDTPLTQSDGTRSGPTEIAVAAQCDRGWEGINRCARLESRDRTYSRHLELSLSGASVGYTWELWVGGRSRPGWTLVDTGRGGTLCDLPNIT